ncbi:MAG TPA: hypothetical protein ENL20_12045 [Candidatus Cloacimonetes bacterium]|nr:hypothetical protein [Candidatus Cloacimonadota bacterium]
MIIDLLNDVWQTYLKIAPYLFIGLIVAGLLHIFFKKDFIIKHLGKNDFLSVVKASVLGVPLPLCSCGVIPTAMHLRKQKASKGATLSFLISTPQTGVDSIIATYGMMGPIFAIFRPLAAFIMGIFGGMITNNLTKDEKEDREDISPAFECDTCEITEPHTHSFLEKLHYGMKYAFVEFLDDISLQLVFGIVLAGIISFVIPENFFARYGGEGFTGMLIMIAFGIPLYVCATASIPIAVSLIMKGISPGAAFVFLVVGPATNAATIALIGNAMGKKIVIIYLSVISIFAILGGFALNFIFDIFGSEKSYSFMQHHQENSLILNILLILFSIILLMSLFRKLSAKIKYGSHRTEDNVSVSENIKIFKIEGMTCNHCVMHVTNAIKEVSGVEDVIVSLNEKNAKISGNFNPEDIQKAVGEAGYKIV